MLAVLGVVALARGHGFWYDEVYTAEVAHVPLGDLVTAVIRGEGTIPYLHDAPPSYNGPYYAFVHLWLLVTPFDASELGLRLLSLLATAAAVAVFSRAVGRLAGPALGPSVGVVAGLFLATNPFVVQYAVEARGYALALLGTCTAALGLACWFDGDRRWRPLYWVGGVAAGLFHWYALLVLAGFAVAAVVLRGRRAVPVVAATALASVPAAAIAGTAVANGVRTSGVEWLQGVGTDVPWLVLRSWSGRTLMLLALTVLTVALGLRRRGPARVVAACWVAVPLVVVTAAELVRPVFVDRYLLPAVVGIAALMALGAVRGSAAVTGWLTAAVLATSLWATAGELHRPPKDDVRGAVSAVAAGHQAGEPVVAAARWDALGVGHYVGRHHPELLPDLILPPADVPFSSPVWVVRRARGGVVGDDTKLEALDRDLAARGLSVAHERRFDGRYADVLVQRWERA